MVGIATGVSLVGALAIGSAAVSAGVGIANSMSANANANRANDRAATTFTEQQGYAQQLSALMADPSSVTKLPGYDFNKQQGEQSIARGMGSQGLAGSGNEAIALDKYGSGYADSAYSTQANLLAGLSGLQTATSPDSYARTGASAQGQSFAQLSSALAGLGYSIGGGSTGGFTTNDAITLASGAGGQQTMPAGGGYIWNNPAFKG